MTIMQQACGLVRKYGRAAKVVATGVLSVVAPGSGSLLDLAGKAIDAAVDTADKIAREDWERDLLARVQGSEAELARLGGMLEYLAGPLAAVCDKAFAFADQPDDLPDIVGRAIAADPKLSRILHDIGGLKEQFNAFQSDMKRLADHQEEAVPVYGRMNRVADYFDELWQAGIKPKDFAHCLRGQREAAVQIQQGETGALDNLFLELRTIAPKAASVCVLEAAAATRDFNYPAAQRALNTAIRLRPGDAGLADLSRRVTVLATGATPKSPPPSPAPTADHPQRLQPGDTLDGWLLEKRLGAGGWGQVFQATREGQLKALKVMHPDFAADRAFVERFKKEIETLIKLPKHSNLVRVESFGYCTARQTWYLTMEFVDGPTLEQYLAAKGPLSEGQIRKVFPDAIDGLAKAHNAGIVHRDIKPGNLIFRKRDQRLVFVDFGLAVGVEDFGQTKVGGISIQFAAPEQHYGDRATQASDVFCVCAVIHYALNHDKPDLRKPNRFAPGLAPDSLRDALTQGMKINAEERFQNAGQLLQALVPTPPLAPSPSIGHGGGEKGPPSATRTLADIAIDKKRERETLQGSAQELQKAGRYAEAVAELGKLPVERRNASLYAALCRDRDEVAALVLEITRAANDDAWHWRHRWQVERLLILQPFRKDGKRDDLGLAALLSGDLIPAAPPHNWIHPSLGMQFVLVPAGRFAMGGGAGKPGDRRILIPDDFYMGVFPVTQGQWQMVMRNNPSYFSRAGEGKHAVAKIKDADLKLFPVENVVASEDIAPSGVPGFSVEEFLAKVNAADRRSGWLYRLPTEAEWEYACRGGPMYGNDWSSDFYLEQASNSMTPDQANFDSALGRTSKVGSYKPNRLGLYDMHGNVFEWNSTEENSLQVIRGGSWRNGDCRAAFRSAHAPSHRNSNLGLRLARVPVGT